MTINRKNYLICWGIILSAAILWAVAYWHYLPHLPDTYSGEAVHGRVADADNGRPIADAIVIGLYELNAPYNMEGGTIAGHMHVEEVVTDVNGNYHLAAWGPKPRPGRAYFEDNTPRILVFKEGYEYFASHYGSLVKNARYQAVQQSYHTGKTIHLKRFVGDIQARTRQMFGLSIVLDSLLNPYFGARNCPWQQIPRMMMTFDRFNQELAVSNITTSLLPELSSLAAEGNCGTREDFIRRYEDEIMDDTNSSAD